MSAHLFKPYELRATEVSGSPDVEALDLVLSQEPLYLLSQDLYTQILGLFILFSEHD